MDNELITKTSMKIILHAGNARSIYHEIIESHKKLPKESVEKKMDEANKELLKAHNFQTKLLQGEARGDEISMTLLLSHAQDTLTEATMEEYLTKVVLKN